MKKHLLWILLSFGIVGIFIMGCQPSDQSSPRKIKFYRHPMNPSITSSAPAKDDMGMDYIAVYENESDIETAENIDGRGRVSLNPTQMDRAAIKTVSAESKLVDYEIRAPGRALSSSQISLQAFEQDIPYLKIGLKVDVQSPTVPDRELTGQIFAIDSFLDPMTRTIRVIVNLSQTAGLKVESSLSAVVHIPLGKVIVIPTAAVIHTGKQNVVYVSKAPGLFIPTAVSLGVKIGDFYEIKEGLFEGDKVAAGPNFLLDSEARIRGAYDSKNH